MLNKIKNLNFKTVNWLLVLLIILNLVIVLSICFFKYFTFSYNGLDLAIFNQVFYNSANGNFFQFTIHPSLYLGDHFTPIIILLLPFYYFFQNALTIVTLQATFSAIAVIPLYLIAKKYLSPWLSLLVIVLYLFNPVTLNINLYEYHVLTMVPFFIFWSFYFYKKNNFKLFIVFTLLSLLIKEDVSFIIFMFGIIALLDRKKIKWILYPLISSSLYFFIAYKIISYFSAISSYKFLIYYQWLGNSLWEIFINLFLKIDQVILHFLSLQNFEFILGFLLVFLFIPIIRPKYLLLGLGMFLQITLGQVSGALTLRMHYGAIFLTVMCLALIFSLKYLSENQRFIKFYKDYNDVFIIIIIIALIYNFLILGPAVYFIQKIYNTDYQTVKIQREYIKAIPDNSSVVTSYDFIPHLSSRKKLYSLNYAYINNHQYSSLNEYLIPKDNQYVLINGNDYLTFNLQYDKPGANFDQNDENMEKLLNGYELVKMNQQISLWQKTINQSELKLYNIYKTEPLPKITNLKNQKINKNLDFVGFTENNNQTSLYFKTLTKIDQNYYLQINKQFYYLGYGLFPTSEWPENKIIEIILYNLPKTKKISLVDLKGDIILDRLGSTQNKLDKINVLTVLNLD